MLFISVFVKVVLHTQNVEHSTYWDLVADTVLWQGMGVSELVVCPVIPVGELFPCSAGSSEAEVLLQQPSLGCPWRPAGHGIHRSS